MKDSTFRHCASAPRMQFPQWGEILMMCSLAPKRVPSRQRATSRSALPNAAGCAVLNARRLNRRCRDHPAGNTVAMNLRSKYAPKMPLTANRPSKSAIFCKIRFNRAQLPDFSSGILSGDPLFSCTFQDRSSYLTSFGVGGVPLVTFCLYKAWRNRHNGRTLEPSRLGKGTAFHPKHKLRSLVYSHI